LAKAIRPRAALQLSEAWRGDSERRPDHLLEGWPRRRAWRSAPPAALWGALVLGYRNAPRDRASRAKSVYLHGPYVPGRSKGPGRGRPPRVAPLGRLPKSPIPPAPVPMLKALHDGRLPARVADRLPGSRSS
jgi:hypothetical protein